MSRLVPVRRSPWPRSTVATATTAAGVGYTIAVENPGSGSPDTDSVTITHTIPDNLAMCGTAASFGIRLVAQVQ